MNSGSAGQQGTRVLVVDDDQEIRSLLAEYLEQRGVCVAQAADGAEMQERLAGETFDLVVLDLSLPGADGLELCRALRAGSDLPVIMLTARTSPPDRIAGLESGADDYVCKPFDPQELLSRIRTVLRRTGPALPQATVRGGPTRIRFAHWVLEVDARHLVDPQGVLVLLSGSEYRLLRFFLDQPNTVLSRDHVMEYLHGRDAGPFDRSVDLQVSRLRQKIEHNTRAPRIIRTIRNEGYILTAPVQVEFG